MRISTRYSSFVDPFDVCVEFTNLPSLVDIYIRNPMFRY